LSPGEIVGNTVGGVQWLVDVEAIPLVGEADGVINTDKELLGGATEEEVGGLELGLAEAEADEVDPGMLELGLFKGVTDELVDGDAEVEGAALELGFLEGLADEVIAELLEGAADELDGG
jgi:hypothetical protein